MAGETVQQTMNDVILESDAYMAAQAALAESSRKLLQCVEGERTPPMSPSARLQRIVDGIIEEVHNETVQRNVDIHNNPVNVQLQYPFLVDVKRDPDVGAHKLDVQKMECAGFYAIKWSDDTSQIVYRGDSEIGNILIPNQIVTQAKLEGDKAEHEVLRRNLPHQRIVRRLQKFAAVILLHVEGNVDHPFEYEHKVIRHVLSRHKSHIHFYRDQPEPVATAFILAANNYQQLLDQRGPGTTRQKFQLHMATRALEMVTKKVNEMRFRKRRRSAQKERHNSDTDSHVASENESDNEDGELTVA